MAKKTTKPGEKGLTHPRIDAPDDASPALQPSIDLQRQLMEAQATIERDYSRLRELETRYRFLLQTSSDAIVLVEAANQRIFDANPAAATCLGIAREALIGSPVSVLVNGDAGDALQGRLDSVRTGADSGSFSIALAGGATGKAFISLFRQDGAAVFLIRLDVLGRSRHAAADAGLERRLAEYTNSAPDAIVLTDRNGIILQANAAFVELVQVATDRQVRGVSLGRWLGRTSVDLGVLVSNLRQRRTLKLFSTQLRAEYGSLTQVEISAALVDDTDTSILGFTIRDVGRRLPAASHQREDISQSVAQLAELVGRVPMKTIVGNTADLIEQMCIKAALELTRNNRAAAAELLGLSRQSLYVKLRRYDLLESGADDEAAA